MAEISRLAQTGAERRLMQVNTYSKEMDYNDIFRRNPDNSPLKRVGNEERDKPHPYYDFDKEIEKPYEGEGYSLEKVKKGDPNDGGHTHTTPNRVSGPNKIVHQLDTDSERGDKNEIANRNKILKYNKYGKDRNEYNLSKVERGNPNDGGHTYSIPSEINSPTLIIPQLETRYDVDGIGNEYDIEARNSLINKNKFNINRQYNVSSIEGIEGLMDRDQYFIPGGPSNWPKDPFKIKKK